MLKKMYGLTEAGRKAIAKASVWLALFQVLCTLPILLIIQVFSKLLDSALSGRPADLNLYVYLGTGLLLIAAMYLSYRKMYRIKYISAADENVTLRMSVMDKLRRLPESYLARRDLSDLTSAVMDDIGTIEGILANQITELFGGLLAILVTLAVLFFFNVKLTLCLCSVLPVAALSMALSNTVSGKTHLKNRNIRLRISDSIQEYLENIRVLKVSGSIETYQNGMKQRMKKLMPRLILFEFLSGMCVSVAYNVLRIGIGIVAVAGAGMLAGGEISIPLYLGFLLMAVWIYEPLSHTCEYLGAVIASGIAAGRLKEIMNTKEQAGDEPVNVRNYDIAFDHVTFGYNENTVLKDVSFTARQGEYTALVGPSGSGKSTVCRLAARFRDVQAGKITIGGQDISKVAPEELCSLFSIVFQDVTLFNDTIYNNILIGNKNATREEVMKAAGNALCMPFIEKLPDGIDTVIGENGHTLSGGERQRLSIARAFLKDAPIILLDESTASVDPETETKIQQAIERLTTGKTVLMIAHRLRSIEDCDRIIVLEDGRVAGNGTHAELMENCELYRRLYTLQKEE